MDKIKFGTDGWRGEIGEDFTFANVRRVAAAIAEYVREEGEPSRGLVVGYDTRFLSPESARAAAEVVASAGIPVVLADRPTPTPAISFAVVERGAAGAMVITASHNPGRWNGVKFKAPYGGSAAPEIVRRIEACLHRLDRSRKKPRRARAARIETADLKTSYLDRLKKLIHLERVRVSGRRFVVDPMFGAGQDCLARIFREAGIPCMEIHGERNPLFPGINPEPIEPHVEALRRAVVEGGFDAGFATDGDADRIGAVDRDGSFIDSHKIFSILLKHLVEDLHLSGEVVKTFSTTRMIDKLASKYGLRLQTTPIGFKYICELMLRRDVLIGGEESGGISVKGHLPERDGILNALFLAEVMADRGKTLGELVAELTAEFGPHYYGRVDLEIEMARAQRFVRQARRFQGRRIAGLRVSGIDGLDGVKMQLGDSAWLLVRASGTENVLRLYSEAPSREQVKAVLDEIAARARDTR
jgi:phosphomannomutase